MEACTAAPYAASSGLIDLQRSFPLNISLNNVWTRGIRVEPPTSTTSSTADLSTPEPRLLFQLDSNNFLQRSSHNDSNLARVIDV